MKPPSLTEAGGSSTTAERSTPSSSPKQESGPTRTQSSLEPQRESTSAIFGSAASELPSARRSRALPAPRERRPHGRSRSETLRRRAKSSSRHTTLPARSSTASSLALISAAERRGAVSQ